MCKAAKYTLQTAENSLEQTQIHPMSVDNTGIECGPSESFQIPCPLPQNLSHRNHLNGKWILPEINLNSLRHPPFNLYQAPTNNVLNPSNLADGNPPSNPNSPLFDFCESPPHTQENKEMNLDFLEWVTPEFYEQHIINTFRDIPKILQHDWSLLISKVISGILEGKPNFDLLFWALPPLVLWAPISDAPEKKESEAKQKIISKRLTSALQGDFEKLNADFLKHAKKRGGPKASQQKSNKINVYLDSQIQIFNINTPHTSAPIANSPMDIDTPEGQIFSRALQSSIFSPTVLPNPPPEPTSSISIFMIEEHTN